MSERKMPAEQRALLKLKGQLQHYGRLIKRNSVEVANKYAKDCGLKCGPDGVPLALAVYGEKGVKVDNAPSPVERSDVKPIFERKEAKVAVAAAPVVPQKLGMFGEVIGVDSPVESATAAEVAPAPTGPEMVNGWPVYTEGVVWATCPNPRLVVIKLPDGRTASMFKEGLGGSPIGVRVQVEMKKRTGDVIYGYLANSPDQSDVPPVLADITAEDAVR